MSAVFFGINSLGLIISVFRVHATAGLIVSGLAWLAGLAAIVLLFRRESGPFYGQQPPLRRASSGAGAGPLGRPAHPTMMR